MQRVVIIGSGNVATHIAKALNEIGCSIIQVYSRQLKHAQLLASDFGAIAVSDPEQINSDADLYLIALTDSAIEEIALKLKVKQGIVVHTAGSVSIEDLSCFNNYGVFYPLQTFSKARKIDFSKIPICLEANNDNVLSKLENLGRRLSENIWILNSEQRKQCHLAAVFVNNFVNHFYVVAEQLLDQKGISFDILKPLILETALKVQELKPIDAQTGPAVRNNQQVINEHLMQLKSTEFEKIYSFVTSGIIAMHNK